MSNKTCPFLLTGQAVGQLSTLQPTNCLERECALWVRLYGLEDAFDEQEVCSLKAMAMGFNVFAVAAQEANDE